MSRTAQINLRVRPGLKAKLEKLAKQDRRTLSAYVEKLLEDYVTEHEVVRRGRPSLLHRSA
jgi:predicted DNA-binding protein